MSVNTLLCDTLGMADPNSSSFAGDGQGGTNHEVHIVNRKTGILEVENDEFTVCTSRFSPSPIHCLCSIFASNSRFTRLLQAPLDTCLDSPFFTSLSVHGLHYKVYAPSRWFLRLGERQSIVPKGARAIHA